MGTIGNSATTLARGAWRIFVEHRVADRRMLRLIRKLLSAGVTEDGLTQLAIFELTAIRHSLFGESSDHELALLAADAISGEVKRKKQGDRH